MVWTNLFFRAAVVALGFTAAAHAQPGGTLTVIADHGGQPATPYYVPISGAQVSESQGYSAHAEARARGPIRETELLPVRSERLTPGAVNARTLELPATTTPFFLIGTDALSRRWLKQRGDRLRELNAVGLIVDIETGAQLQQLRGLGRGLVMRPVAGDDMARRLNLSHYPVLVTPEGLQQ